MGPLLDSRQRRCNIGRTASGNSDLQLPFASVADPATAVFTYRRASQRE